MRRESHDVHQLRRSDQTRSHTATVMCATVHGITEVSPQYPMSYPHPTEPVTAGSRLWPGQPQPALQALRYFCTLFGEGHEDGKHTRKKKSRGEREGRGLRGGRVRGRRRRMPTNATTTTTPSPTPTPPTTTLTPTPTPTPTFDAYQGHVSRATHVLSIE